ncbi:Fic family protein [uncultured Campylobacter sp.]|uniref:Fic family protein n=1 Tax=uncultured Campylobacter sp. TaxID=218934 RepID=UPI0026024280|nr:Fic family protein [uncultured Campylobacter sp.]
MEKFSSLEILLYEKRNHIKNGFYHLNQIVFAYNSNHIEGSRLSKEQTRHIYETSSFFSEKDGEEIKINDILETRNHFKAFDFILESFNVPITHEFLKELHRILKNGTSDDVIGDYKKTANYIGDFSTTKPKQVVQEIERLLSEYTIKTNIDIKDIIDFHYKFERIHPFEDGNGRIGRLIMFKECLKNGITPFIIDVEHQAFYYRGLKNYENQKGFLIDTCLSCQDEYEAILKDYIDGASIDLNEAYSTLEKVMSGFGTKIDGEA